FVFQVSLENLFYRLVVLRLSHHPIVKRTNLHKIARIYKLGRARSIIRIKAGNSCNSLDLFKVLNEVFQMGGIVYKDHNGSLKNAVITGNRDGADIYLEIIGYDLGDFV